MNLNNPEGYKNETTELLKQSDEKFILWFDGGGSIKGAFEKAEDIFTRLFLPHARKHLRRLDNKKALDIGYGAGLKVYEAAKHFKESHGVDCHGKHDDVFNLLHKYGEDENVADIYLRTAEANNLPYDDGEFDFVHSWTTFLHFDTYSYVVETLNEIYRVLKPGGVAVIYFTRLVRKSNAQTIAEYKADLKTEESQELGYREGGPLTKVRATGIIIALWKMIESAKEIDFQIVKKTYSHDKNDDRSVTVFGQHGLVLRKKKPRYQPKKTADSKKSTVRETLITRKK
jgi:SAM-dependent methyltransferase